MRYFFYGTLLDADVRRIVLGPWIGRSPLAPAMLPQYRRVYLRGRDYPVVIPDRRAAVEGILAAGLDGRAAARLAAFESDEYVLTTLAVRLDTGESVIARVFVASRLAHPTDRDWDIATWQREHKKAFARRHRWPLESG